MKKSDLHSGDIVQHRNGDKGIVLLQAQLCDEIRDLIIDLKNGCYLKLIEFNNDLKMDNDSDFDIVKVCSDRYVGDNIRHHIINNEDFWTWERPEEKKEMTIEEIEKELGYSIKIVK